MCFIREIILTNINERCIKIDSRKINANFKNSLYNFLREKRRTQKRGRRQNESAMGGSMGVVSSLFLERFHRISTRPLHMISTGILSHGLLDSTRAYNDIVTSLFNGLNRYFTGISWLDHSRC